MPHPHCLRAGGPRTRPQAGMTAGPGLHGFTRAPQQQASDCPALLPTSYVTLPQPPDPRVPHSAGVRLQPCLCLCTHLSHVSGCTVGLLCISLSLCVSPSCSCIYLCLPLHPPLSVDFCLYLSSPVLPFCIEGSLSSLVPVNLHLSRSPCLSVSLRVSLCVSPCLSRSVSPLPLSLSFSGISINPVYYALLLLRTFAFEIAAGGLRTRVAWSCCQAPRPHWGPNRRCRVYHPYLCRP